MELQALVLSWLAACGGCVVQPLRGQPWLTPQLPLLHWASAAARCGLPVADQSAVAAPAPWDATVLVAGPLSTGILAGRLGVACVATAQNLGFTLLEFRFQRDSEEPRWSMSAPTPNSATWKTLTRWPAALPTWPSAPWSKNSHDPRLRPGR